MSNALNAPHDDIGMIPDLHADASLGIVLVDAGGLGDTVISITASGALGSLVLRLSSRHALMVEIG